MKHFISLLSAYFILQSGFGQQLLFQSRAYSIYSNKVVQGNMEAIALSPTEIVSGYKSPANEFQSTKLSFKFSINGKDNEMRPGMDHHFNLLPRVTETPVIRFGAQLKDNSGETNIYLKPDRKLKIRVDMNSILADFKTKGYYTTFKGDKIYKEDFKGLYVAGNTLPMIWDFDNIHNREELELKDPDGDGIYETILVLNAQKDEKATAVSWKLSKNITAFPQYKSGHAIADAIYNMSVEEMIRAVEPDSTFRTGKEWAGVWTRDISYSIILSMAYLQPEVAKNSLLRKVNKKKRIIQDTGTGGAYPCSTDRIIWAVAAWEIYKATGDKDWLQQAFQIIKNSIEDDMNVAYDAGTGLVKGESSFLDWREQTYPKWMQPADIYESENLGTNAVHYQANMLLSQMAGLLKNAKATEKYKANAEKIKAGINRYLWMGDKGYYAQYLYGRNFKIVSPRSEALGEALCVLFGIADARQQASIIANTPVTDYGISCIYPQIPDIPPYHNNAVWPFVQSYWALASAKISNENSVMESLAAIYRPAAMFLTNKENFVADNGDFAGTIINSSNMLWSLSGNLSIIHKIIFGIVFHPGKLVFHPFVPKMLNGDRFLTNFKYRSAMLNISMEGFGNKIQSFLLDGETMAVPEIPANLQGKHAVRIILTNNSLPAGGINKVNNHVAPASPFTSYSQNSINWQKVEGAILYNVLKNGKSIARINKTTIKLTAAAYAEYQVIAIDEKGFESFASEPLVVAGEKSVHNYEAENFTLKASYTYKGFSGNGFVEINKKVNKAVNILITINKPGFYSIDVRYANGNGPINTENKCAVRTLKVNGIRKGTFVFPQRGKDEWSNWGFSNAAQLYFKKGSYNLLLSLEEYNDNMNGAINHALIDYIRVSKL
ncbi:MAG: trehalase family glycosidase [Sediminibacterium sp.]|nr:trehalase family glycosidase [Sediminibacterium sp.]